MPRMKKATPVQLELEEAVAAAIKAHPKGKPLNEKGELIVSSIPIAPPIGYKPSPSIAEMVRNMVRSEKLRAEAEAAGFESFEEADDFDVEDDIDPSSPFEAVFEPPIEPQAPSTASPTPAPAPAPAPAPVASPAPAPAPAPAEGLPHSTKP